MSAQAAVYGRLGRDPETRGTANGKTMAVASVAVDLECRERGQDTSTQAEWFNVIAFGRAAETLSRHEKGDLVSVAGRLQLSAWATSTGETRRQFQIVADSVVSARSVRPSSGRRHNPPDEPVAAQGGAPAAPADPNDEIPF